MSFYLSKIIWLIFNPFNIFIFLTIISLIFYFLYLKKLSIIIFLTNFTCLLTISIFPIGNYLIYKLEKEYHSKIQPPQNLHGILILGGATNPLLFKDHEEISFNDAAERLIEAFHLIKKYKNIKVIMTGGSGLINETEIGHADVAKIFFNKMDLDTSKIIFENKSRNTNENIILSKKIAKPNNDEKWLIITSAFHMKRAILIGQKNNWEFIPYAVDFKSRSKFNFKPSIYLWSNLSSFQLASHEWIGLVSYFLMQRTDKIF